MRAVKLKTGIGSNPHHEYGAVIDIVEDGGDPKSGAVTLAVADGWIARRLAYWHRPGEMDVPPGLTAPEVERVVVPEPVAEVTIPGAPPLFAHVVKKNLGRL